MPTSSFQHNDCLSTARAGKGRGRQVIAVARTSDMILMMLDAEKAERQKELLTHVRMLRLRFVFDSIWTPVGRSWSRSASG